MMDDCADDCCCGVCAELLQHAWAESALTDRTQSMPALPAVTAIVDASRWAGLVIYVTVTCYNLKLEMNNFIRS